MIFQSQDWEVHKCIFVRLYLHFYEAILANTGISLLNTIYWVLEIFYFSV